ncbi:PAB1 binding protein [Vanrija albida]|uniref:PAB1 binding protein n=1 Tax=Vanrija albida TaxID=181172 RepID=A0ABR3PV01_9TREE
MTPSLAPPPRLSPLPVELVQLILDRLPPGRDLATCLRVNSFFFTAASALLYRHVRMFQHGRWNLDLFSVQPHIYRSRVELPTVALASRPTLAESVHLVDVFEHSTEDCEAVHLDTLHVDTLRINLRQHKDRAVLHNDMWLQDWCGALDPIQAEKIVVRGPLVLDDGVLSAPSIAPETLLQAKRLTIVAIEALSANSDVTFQMPFSPLLSERSSVRNVTFVFWTRKPGERWSPIQPFQQGQERSARWATAFSSYLVTGLVSRWPYECNVTMVNAGSIEAADLSLDDEPTYEHVQEQFRAEVRLFISNARLDQRGKYWREEELADRVKWITMREYLATPDWAGEFGDEEVAPWLKRFERGKGGGEANGNGEA